MTSDYPNDGPPNVDAEKNIRMIIDKLLRATVRLVKFEPGEKLPHGMASGFVIRAKERCFVITAAHAIQSGQWWMELATRQNGEPAGILIPFSAHWVLMAKVTLPGQVKKVDFGWAEIDLERLWAHAENDAKFDIGKLLIEEYKGPLDEPPEPEEPYAFCAFNQPEAGLLPSGKYWLERRPTYEVGMEFAGEHSNELAYIFKLARNHQGHDYYKGASGAPIADASGKIVSVVLSGHPDENAIYGAKLSDFAHLIGEDL